MVQPIDYSGGNGFLQGLQTADAYQQTQQRRAQAEQAEAQLEQAKKFHAELPGAINDPQKLQALAVKYPTQLAEIKDQLQFKSAQDVAAVSSATNDLQTAAQIGPEAVANALTKHAATVQSKGATPQQLMQLYTTNPQAFGSFINTVKLGAMNAKDQFAVQNDQVQRQQDQQKIDETVRNNDMTNARGWGQIAVSRENSIRSANAQMSGQGLAAQRLSLDQDKFAFEQQQAKEKADLLKNGAPKLTDATSKMIDSSISTAAASQNSANTMNTLADQLDKDKPTAGLFGSMQNNIAKITGSDNYIRDLKIRRSQLASSQAVKNLPPGPASDKDIQFAREGIPDDKDSPEVWARWLRGNAKMEQINADYNNFKAEWVSSNGNPGQSRNDGNILGLDVRKGESMNVAMKRYIAQQQSDGNQQSTDQQPSAQPPAEGSYKSKSGITFTVK